MENHHSGTEQRRRLRVARRAVIKLGTGIVTGSDGQFNVEHLEPVARTIAALKKDGRQVVLVSSGAVGLGRGRLGLHRDRLNDLVMRQACAAVGQSLLMHEYEKLFQTHGVQLAQVLLTEGDFVDRTRYSNLRQTMETLLKLGVLPVVNENDTVSTAELDYLNIRAGERIFSDNDRLAALVMSHIEADVLVLLTDVDGLLQLGPSGSKEDGGDVIPMVEEITPELKALAFGPSEGGRGGMMTKLAAAEIAMQSGGVAVIANGRNPDTLGRVLAGEPVGTVFLSQSRMPGKQRWLAYAAGVRGRMIVNAGAREALTGGKASLLASGVVGVEGEFEAAEVVSIVDHEGLEFARGISDYSRGDAEDMIGQSSAGRIATVHSTDDAEISAHRSETRAAIVDELKNAVSTVSSSSAKTNGRATVLVKRDNIVLLDRK